MIRLLRASAWVLAFVLCACSRLGNPPLSFETPPLETTSNGVITLRTTSTSVPSTRLSEIERAFGRSRPDFVDTELNQSPFVALVDVRSQSRLFVRGNLRTKLVFRDGREIERLWRSSPARLGGTAVFRVPSPVIAASTTIE